MYSLIYVDDNIVGYQADDVNGTFTQEEAYKCVKCNKLNPTQEEFDNVMQKIENKKPMELLRGERNRILDQSDWRMTEDYPNTDKESWKVYRQALRDLPSTAQPQLDENGNLTNVNWPERPE